MSNLLPRITPAVLVLADGRAFRGKSIGVPGSAIGEVVFNTSMTGYQEILSDPSYCGQMVTLTVSHVGNVGANPDDDEAAKVFASGLIVRDAPDSPSNFRAAESLSAYLTRHNIVAISDIDTRALTRHLREHGAQNGCIIAAESISDVTVTAAHTKAQKAPSMAGLDLAKVVTTATPYTWTEGTWSPTAHATPAKRFKVAAYDYGIKRNILRMLADRGCEVTVFPAQTPASVVLARQPDGVFLSNGPGDPEPCTYAIEAIRQVIDAKVPVFGICLGHQLLALASGAKTHKMKFGHHGGNHPVKNHTTGAVAITAQNHGFAVDPESLPATLRVTHISLFDDSIQGIERTDVRAFSFQGHPEASPGPHDIGGLFDRFVGLMEKKSG